MTHLLKQFRQVIMGVMLIVTPLFVGKAVAQQMNPADPFNINTQISTNYNPATSILQAFYNVQFIVPVGLSVGDEVCLFYATGNNLPLPIQASDYTLNVYNPTIDVNSINFTHVFLANNQVRLCLSNNQNQPLADGNYSIDFSMNVVGNTYNNSINKCSVDTNNMVELGQYQGVGQISSGPSGMQQGGGTGGNTPDQTSLNDCKEFGFTTPNEDIVPTTYGYNVLKKHTSTELISGTTYEMCYEIIIGHNIPSGQMKEIRVYDQFDPEDPGITDGVEWVGNMTLAGSGQQTFYVCRTFDTSLINEETNYINNEGICPANSVYNGAFIELYDITMGGNPLYENDYTSHTCICVEPKEPSILVTKELQDDVKLLNNDTFAYKMRITNNGEVPLDNVNMYDYAQLLDLEGYAYRVYKSNNTLKCEVDYTNFPNTNPFKINAEDCYGSDQQLLPGEYISIIFYTTYIGNGDVPDNYFFVGANAAYTEGMCGEGNGDGGPSSCIQEADYIDPDMVDIAPDMIDDAFAVCGDGALGGNIGDICTTCFSTPEQWYVDKVINTATTEVQLGEQVTYDVLLDLGGVSLEDINRNNFSLLDTFPTGFEATMITINGINYPLNNITGQLEIADYLFLADSNTSTNDPYCKLFYSGNPYDTNISTYPGLPINTDIEILSSGLIPTFTSTSAILNHPLYTNVKYYFVDVLGLTNIRFTPNHLDIDTNGQRLYTNIPAYAYAVYACKTPLDNGEDTDIINIQITGSFTEAGNDMCNKIELDGPNAIGSFTDDTAEDADMNTSYDDGDVPNTGAVDDVSIDDNNESCINVIGDPVKAQYNAYKTVIQSTIDDGIGTVSYTIGVSNTGETDLGINTPVVLFDELEQYMTLNSVVYNGVTYPITMGVDTVIGSDDDKFIVDFAPFEQPVIDTYDLYGNTAPSTNWIAFNFGTLSINESYDFVVNTILDTSQIEVVENEEADAGICNDFWSFAQVPAGADIVVGNNNIIVNGADYAWADTKECFCPDGMECETIDIVKGEGSYSADTNTVDFPITITNNGTVNIPNVVVIDTFNTTGVNTNMLPTVLGDNVVYPSAEVDPVGCPYADGFICIDVKNIEPGSTTIIVSLPVMDSFEGEICNVKVSGTIWDMGAGTIANVLYGDNQGFIPDVIYDEDQCVTTYSEEGNAILYVDKSEPVVEQIGNQSLLQYTFTVKNNGDVPLGSAQYPFILYDMVEPYMNITAIDITNYNNTTPSGIEWTGTSLIEDTLLSITGDDIFVDPAVDGYTDASLDTWEHTHANSFITTPPIGDNNYAFNFGILDPGESYVYIVSVMITDQQEAVYHENIMDNDGGICNAYWAYGIYPEGATVLYPEASGGGLSPEWVDMVQTYLPNIDYIWGDQRVCICPDGIDCETFNIEKEASDFNVDNNINTADFIIRITNEGTLPIDNIVVYDVLSLEGTGITSSDDLQNIVVSAVAPAEVTYPSSTTDHPGSECNTVNNGLGVICFDVNNVMPGETTIAIHIPQENGEAVCNNTVGAIEWSSESIMGPLSGIIPDTIFDTQVCTDAVVDPTTPTVTIDKWATSYNSTTGEVVYTIEIEVTGNVSNVILTDVAGSGLTINSITGTLPGDCTVAQLQGGGCTLATGVYTLTVTGIVDSSTSQTAFTGTTCAMDNTDSHNDEVYYGDGTGYINTATISYSTNTDTLTVSNDSCIDINTTPTTPIVAFSKTQTAVTEDANNYIITYNVSVNITNAAYNGTLSFIENPGDALTITAITESSSDINVTNSGITGVAGDDITINLVPTNTANTIPTGTYNITIAATTPKNTIPTDLCNPINNGDYVNEVEYNNDNDGVGNNDTCLELSSFTVDKAFTSYNEETGEIEYNIVVTNTGAQDIKEITVNEYPDERITLTSLQGITITVADTISSNYTSWVDRYITNLQPGNSIKYILKGYINTNVSLQNDMFDGGICDENSIRNAVIVSAVYEDDTIDTQQDDVCTEFPGDPQEPSFLLYKELISYDPATGIVVYNINFLVSHMPYTGAVSIIDTPGSMIDITNVTGPDGYSTSTTGVDGVNYGGSIEINTASGVYPVANYVYVVMGVVNGIVPIDACDGTSTDYMNTAMITVPINDGDNDTGVGSNNESSDCIGVIDVIKEASGDGVYNVNEEFTYTITVTNNATSAQTVVIKDISDSGIMLNNYTVTGAISGNTLGNVIIMNNEFTTGDIQIAEGGVVTITVSATMNADMSTVITDNTDVTDCSDTLNNGINNQVTVLINDDVVAIDNECVDVPDDEIEPRSPILTVEKTAMLLENTYQTDGIYDVQYTITVTNSGAVDAVGVQVIDVPQSGIVLSGTLTNTVDIPANSIATITYIGTINTNNTTGICPNGAYNNAVGIMGGGTGTVYIDDNTPSDNDDNNVNTPADDNVCVDIPTPPVPGQPQLAVYKTVSTDTPVVGTPYTYTITVVNTGDTAATNVVVVDEVEAPILLTCPTGYTCTGNNTQNINITIPTVAANNGIVQLVISAVIPVGSSVSSTHTAANIMNSGLQCGDSVDGGEYDVIENNVSNGYINVVDITDYTGMPTGTNIAADQACVVPTIDVVNPTTPVVTIDKHPVVDSYNITTGAVQYTITITVEHGPITNAVLTDIPGSGLTINSISGTNCTLLPCNLGTLQNGTYTYTVNGTIDSSVAMSNTLSTTCSTDNNEMYYNGDTAYINTATLTYTYPNAPGTLSISNDSCVVPVITLPTTPTIQKTVNQPTLSVGSNFTYTLTLTNNNNTAYTVDVKDIEPQGVQFISYQIGSGTVQNIAPTATELLIEDVIIPANGSVVIAINAQIIALLTGINCIDDDINTADYTNNTIINTAQILTPNTNTILNSNPTCIETPIITPTTPVYDIEKVATIQTFTPLQSFNYGIVITNTNNIAGVVNVLDTAPNGIDFVCPAVITGAINNGTVVCNSGSFSVTGMQIAAGGTVNITLPAVVESDITGDLGACTDEDGPIGGVDNDTTQSFTNAINNVVSLQVQGSTAPSITNNTCINMDVIVPNPSLEVSKTGVLNADNTITYTVQVWNTGTVNMDNIVLTDTVQSGIMLATGYTMGNLSYPFGANNTINIASLPTTNDVNNKITITFTATFTPAGMDIDASQCPNNSDNLFNNHIELTSAEYVNNGTTTTITDANTDTDSNDDACISPQMPAITITKVANNTTSLMPGDSFTYTLTVQNTGAVVLDNIVITDTPEAGILINSVSMGTLTGTNPYTITLPASTTLAVGQSIDITVNAQIADNVLEGGQCSEQDTLSNTASVTAQTPTDIAVNDTTDRPTDVIIVDSVPQYMISKTATTADGDSMLETGEDTITYSINVIVNEYIDTINITDVFPCDVFTYQNDATINNNATLQTQVGACTTTQNIDFTITNIPQNVTMGTAYTITFTAKVKNDITLEDGVYCNSIQSQCLASMPAHTACVIYNTPDVLDLAIEKTGPSTVSMNANGEYAFNYTLTVSNIGTQNATNVAVQETPGNGITLVGYTINGVTSAMPANNIISVGTLNIGQSTTITLSAILTPEADNTHNEGVCNISVGTNTYLNTATVGTLINGAVVDDNAPNDGNSEDTDTHCITPIIDTETAINISVDKSIVADYPYIDSDNDGKPEVVFMVVVSADGTPNTLIEDIVLTDTPGAGMALIGYSNTLGGVYTAFTGSPYTIPVGDYTIPSSGSGTVNTYYIKAELTPTILPNNNNCPLAGMYENKVGVIENGDDIETTMTDNTDIACTPLPEEPIVDIALEKRLYVNNTLIPLSEQPKTVNSTDVISYELVLTNNGDTDYTNSNVANCEVALYDTLPTGMTFGSIISSTNEYNSMTDTNGTLKFCFDKVVKDDTIAVKFTVNANNMVSGDVCNVFGTTPITVSTGTQEEGESCGGYTTTPNICATGLTCTYTPSQCEYYTQNGLPQPQGCIIDGPGICANNTDVSNDVCVHYNRPNLAIYKVVNDNSVDLAQAFTYTITVVNTGSIAATNVSVSDTAEAPIVLTNASNNGVITGQNVLWTGLTIPASTATGPGILTLTVSGTIANTPTNIASIASHSNTLGCPDNDSDGVGTYDVQEPTGTHYYKNTASITQYTYDGNIVIQPTNLSDNACVDPILTTIPNPDMTLLSITKAVNMTTVAYGGELTYTLTVVVNGNKPAQNVVISDVLSDTEFDITYDYDTTTTGIQPTQCVTNCTGYSYDSATKTVKYTIGTLDIGTHTYSFKVKVKNDAALKCGAVVNNATITAANASSATSNQTSTAMPTDCSCNNTCGTGTTTGTTTSNPTTNGGSVGTGSTTWFTSGTTTGITNPPVRPRPIPIPQEVPLCSVEYCTVCTNADGTSLTKTVDNNGIWDNITHLANGDTADYKLQLDLAIDGKIATTETKLIIRGVKVKYYDTYDSTNNGAWLTQPTVISNGWSVINQGYNIFEYSCNDRNGGASTQCSNLLDSLTDNGNGQISLMYTANVALAGDIIDSHNVDNYAFAEVEYDYDYIMGTEIISGREKGIIGRDCRMPAVPSKLASDELDYITYADDARVVIHRPKADFKGGNTIKNTAQNNNVLYNNTDNEDDMEDTNTISMPTNITNNNVMDYNDIIDSATNRVNSDDMLSFALRTPDEVVDNCNIEPQIYATEYENVYVVKALGCDSKAYIKLTEFDINTSQTYLFDANTIQQVALPDDVMTADNTVLAFIGSTNFHFMNDNDSGAIASKDEFKGIIMALNNNKITSDISYDQMIINGMISGDLYNFFYNRRYLGDNNEDDAVVVYPLTELENPDYMPPLVAEIASEFGIDEE